MARILLIEDSPTDTAVLTQLLERNGHQVLASASAEDGIAVCRREKPAQHAQQARLAAAVGAGHAQELARLEGEAQRAEQRPPAALAFQVGGLQHAPIVAETAA